MSKDFIEPNRLPPDIRYCRDATFASLVNILEAAIRRCDYTPTEIREAAMLAAIRYEQYRACQIRIGAVPVPECTCKNRIRMHEESCYWYMKHEEDELRMRMNIQAFGEISLQDKNKKDLDSLMEES